MSSSPEHILWRAINQRCYNPRNSEYRNYGARGIQVCEQWRKSFAAFFADMGKRPDPKLTLERINNDGNYEPGNVRWATRSEQMHNTRVTHTDYTARAAKSWATRRAKALNHAEPLF